mgnify:FL=1
MRIIKNYYRLSYLDTKKGYKKTILRKMYNLPEFFPFS